MKKAYFNWSSGKDSAFALYKAMKSETYDVQNLFTIIKKQGSKSAMHEIGIDLLKQQANAIGIPLTVLEFDLAASPDEYEKSMKTQMEKFKGEQINTALFGDLYLQDLRNRRIEHCKQQGIQAEFPLWNSKPDELLREFISLGFKSIVTCVDTVSYTHLFTPTPIQIDAAFISVVIGNDRETAVSAFSLSRATNALSIRL